MLQSVAVGRPFVGYRPLSDLASALARLRGRAELSRRQLEVVSTISEETIKAIEYGRNTRPTPDTLRKLATGLATNRALARVDQDAAEEMLVTLMRAAGYLPDTDAAPVSARSMADMRALLMAKGFRPDQAPVVDQILDELVGRSEDQQDQIINAVATLLALRPER
jgi:transcriptional regulator with XRE-family HTH domain